MVSRIVGTLIVLTQLGWTADVVYFRDGKTVSGSFLGGDSRQLRFVVGDRIQNIPIPDILRIEFGSTSSSTSTPPTPAPAPQRADGLQPSRIGTETAATATPTSSSSPSNNGSVPTLVDIPSGTNMVVRLIDPVDSEVDTMGQTYRATLDEPIVVGGETIIQRGADIVAKLVDDKQSGKITGQTVLTLDLVSITRNGKVLDIDTQEITQSSGSRTAKSTKVIGGLAALGAIIGGIAGGGKGAAVGAVSGAGAGTAAQVMTKGQKVRIPAETRLTFTLQNPVRL